MTKAIDKDIKVLNVVVRALEQSTSRRMLLATLRFVQDRFLEHPSEHLPEHLREGKP